MDEERITSSEPQAATQLAPLPRSAPPQPEMRTPAQAPGGDGIDELQELAVRNPADLGVQIALAAVYTRLGNFDGALQVYRRIVKRRMAPPFILQVIAEDLGYFEAETRPNPRLHLVRGDLYVAEGRYREAMEEYNKMARLAGQYPSR